MRSPLAQALGRVPSGLFIVTTGVGDQATGFLASWVQQAGFAPPALTIAIAPQRPVLAQLRRTGGFCVCVVQQGAKQLLRHFAKGFAPGVPAFVGLETALASQGIPYLLGALAYLGCRVLGEAQFSDHVLICGEVLEGACLSQDPPTVHVRKNGLSY